MAVAESEAHPAVRAALDRAADALAGAGYAVEAAEPPEVDRLLEVWYRIVFADFRVTMEDAVRRLGSPEVNRIVDAYFSVAGPVPGLDAYVRDLAERNRLLRAWNLFLEDYPLVLAPVSTEPPFPVNDDLGGPERVREIFHSLRYTSGMNLLGLPGAVAPTGLHGKAPIGVQIVGRRYRGGRLPRRGAGDREFGRGALRAALGARAGGGFGRLRRGRVTRGFATHQQAHPSSFCFPGFHLPLTLGTEFRHYRHSPRATDSAAVTMKPLRLPPWACT